MLIDTRLTWPVFVVLILCCIFPFIEASNLLTSLDISVRTIENIQALLLFAFAMMTYVYMKPLQLKSGQKEFWLWAICWWLVLFGRSTSWGRDYFPDVPKVYFRAISIVLIGAVVFPLFNRNLRQEIAHKFKTATISIWGIALAIFGLVVSDGIEHDRWISNIFLHHVSNKNFVEEMFEFPLIIGLFLVAFVIMQADKTQKL